jgi:solute carrier family 35 (UDP-galactose transporter), member B1
MKHHSSFGTEIRLVCYVIGLYTAFIYWGYLQEKITSTNYFPSSSVDGSETTQMPFKWQYPFSLNVFMALATFLIASLGDLFDPSKSKTSIWVYSQPAITCALGSPIGYMALEYISFPLVVLVKSSKPVPVMLVGIFLYNKSYPWYKYVSVLLLCGGIALFSFFTKSSSSSSSSHQETDLWTQCLGIFLVGLNVFLDGYTNNQQDYIFEKYHSTSLQMMKSVNIWQLLYLLLYLFFGYLLWGQESELWKSSQLFLHCPQLRFDILLFCLCAAIGQLFIFAVMKEFGSLMWVTLSITRKLFTILISIVIFNHQISSFQWLGIVSVFLGMTLEVVMNYSQKEKQKKKDA